MIGRTLAHYRIAASIGAGGMGEASAIEALADRGKTWRVRTRALVSLAVVAPEAARGRLVMFGADPIWEARVYAARFAKQVNDEAPLAGLSRDVNPNWSRLR